ncbi:MAG TPA: ATP-binding protein, partial [Planctomycetota bacterium]|nr:ATP-binding protein [Planctomycetota bacterium]
SADERGEDRASLDVAFSVETASSGEEALELARAARGRGEPFGVAFIDVRMPPGIDGARVARILREEDQDLEVVLITAYADRTLQELNSGSRASDRLLFLKKPYAREEIYQLALSLSEKRIQRRTARGAKDRLELILRSTEDGLVGLDADHRVVFVNRSARDLLGLPEGPVRDTLWSDLAALGPRRLPTGPCVELRRGDRWIELGEVTPAEGADRVRGVLAVRDVTARKEIERLKDEFVQNTSHELRTPLVAIRGYLDLALEGKLGALEPPLAKGLGVARRASGKLLDLIDALLELARLEALGTAALDLVPLDLSEVARHALEAVRPAAEARGLALEASVPADAVVVGDRRTLEVALRNLLGNAIKFTEKGAVGVRATRDADRVRIEVWDTGPGLPPGIEPEKLFERFRQGDGSISRRQGGVGIGLSLVERILRLHATRARAGNRVGGGAAFSFELVAARPGTVRPPRALKTEPRRGTVLVVDRSETTRDFLRLLVGAEGFEARAFATAAEADLGGLPCVLALAEPEAALAVAQRFAPARAAVLATRGERAQTTLPVLEKPVSLSRLAALLAAPERAREAAA